MGYYLQLLVNGISMGAVYAIIAVGWALIFNILKFSNFAHGGTMVVAAYGGMLCTQVFGGNLWLTLICAALIGGVLNIAVEFVSFRRIRVKTNQLLLLFVSAITMGLLLQNLVAIRFGGIFYSYPDFFANTNRYITVLGLSVDTADLYMLLVASVCILALILILKKTRLGVAVRALSMDSRATSLMGMNVNLIVLSTFFLAGALAGVAGVFVGTRTVLSPTLGSTYTVKAFMVAVIGGLGSLNGALYAALMLGILETFLTSWIGSALQPVGSFVFMMIFLLLFPNGLAGNFTSDKA